ncbi:MAG: helix-turn-helix transcriptional regulator [Oscillospiraceae bacterium]
MMTDRANAICLLEILREYSDEEHPLAMREIIQKMNVIYDLKPDRRTIYSAVALLIELGYDISTYDDNGVGYYLYNRDFEQSEILLLSNAVHSFPFISVKQSEELIQKLQKQLSIHKRKQYKSLTLVRQEKKTNNRQVFLNIELLDEAIHNVKQVSFSYLQYGTDKKLHLRRKEPYVVNPYGMVFMNEHYYLVCNLSGKPCTSLYRIDRIKDISVLDLEWDKQPESDSEVENAVYAFSGKAEYIKMRCDKVILNDAIDQFGMSAKIRDLNENEFELTVKVPPRGVKFWALQYLPYAEVLEPKWLRDEIVESVKANKYGL